MPKVVAPENVLLSVSKEEEAAVIVIGAVPSKATLLMLRAVASLVAVPALPVMLAFIDVVEIADHTPPFTAVMPFQAEEFCPVPPYVLPMIEPCQVPLVILPPMPTLPIVVKVPSCALLEKRFVELAVVEKRLVVVAATPVNVPPVMATLLAFCVDMVPRPVMSEEETEVVATTLPF